MVLEMVIDVTTDFFSLQSIKYLDFSIYTKCPPVIWEYCKYCNIKSAVTMCLH